MCSGSRSPFLFSSLCVLAIPVSAVRMYAHTQTHTHTHTHLIYTQDTHTHIPGQPMLFPSRAPDVHGGGGYMSSVGSSRCEPLRCGPWRCRVGFPALCPPIGVVRGRVPGQYCDVQGCDERPPIYMCIKSQIYIYTYIYIYTHTNTHTHMYVCVCVCVCVCIYIYIYIHIYIYYIYIYTHIHIHTHTHMRGVWRVFIMWWCCRRRTISWSSTSGRVQQAGLSWRSRLERMRTTKEGYE